jgi:diguanylate cyclase (GGDEF)-like protein
MIDIDFFKLLNDHAGHSAGDACLRQVASALQRAVRPGDLLAHCGGEEFVALVHGADSTQAAVVAERLRAAVEKLRITAPKSPFEVVTVNIGSASAQRHDARAAEELLDSADQALYEAKRLGRNQVQVS